jgi:hypothetical protein
MPSIASAEIRSLSVSKRPTPTRHGDKNLTHKLFSLSKFFCVLFGEILVSTVSFVPGSNAVRKIENGRSVGINLI